MSFLWGKEEKRRARLFRSLVRNTLAWAQDDRFPPCENILMKMVNDSITISEKDFLSFPYDFDYEELALNVLKNMAFSEVISGKYHFYRGQLNPIGLQLKNVCVRCAYRAKEKGYLNEDDYNEFVGDLSSGIKNVG